MRNEYPRPDFVRKSWLSLNGKWDFAFDDLNLGHKQKWYKSHQFETKIEVPFCFQSVLSLINIQEFHDHVWYKRLFTIPEVFKDKRAILHIGACDYESEVYINGEMVKKNIGGMVSYEVDITDYLVDKEEQEIVIYAYDPSTNEFIPRGKQYWKEKIEGIWYHRTTGLWQSVWVEFVNDIYIEKVRMVSDIDKGLLMLEVGINKKGIYDLFIKVIDNNVNEVVIDSKYQVKGQKSKITLDIFQDQVMNSFHHHHGKTWSPENPYLFDIEFSLEENNQLLDNVKSYFGMRKIHASDGIIYLNNRPYYQKLILDQGYFEKGLLTAPTDDDFVNDIILAKKMGFNGCRKHQKVEDPRFLYHADCLGFIVWGEMANSPNFNEDYVERITNEWIRVVKRDYNHPCIVAWVPLNESWGVNNIANSKLEMNHALTLYHLTKSIDETRLVISNDGWEMTITDICGVHNYNHGNENEKNKHIIFEKSLSDKNNMLSYMPAGRSIYVNGYKNKGEPIMLTEFGGISFKVDGEGWGYTSVNKQESFLKEYKRLIEAISKSNCISGFCYTQLTDVFQEINGLLTFERKPKVALEDIKKINDFLNKMMNSEIYDKEQE